MIPFVGNIERLTMENPYFRHVIYTGRDLQLVLMSIPPGGEIGMEVHKELDQFIRVEHGICTAIIGNDKFKLADDDAFIIPAGTYHNVINRSKSKPLKIYSIYSRQEHRDGKIDP